MSYAISGQMLGVLHSFGPGFQSSPGSKYRCIVLYRSCSIVYLYDSMEMVWGDLLSNQQLIFWGMHSSEVALYYYKSNTRPCME